MPRVSSPTAWLTVLIFLSHDNPWLHLFPVFTLSPELPLFLNWGQGVTEPQPVRSGNCGMYTPQVICSSQGLSQCLLRSQFWRQRGCQCVVLSPLILIFTGAFASELQLCSRLTGGQCFTGCLITEGPVLCGLGQGGLTCVALFSSCVCV